MSIYYRDSGLTWGQYLQADSFVQDITGEIKRSGEGIKTAVSDQTRNIVASNDALAMEFGEGFDRVNSTLEWGLGRVAGELSELRAAFSYGMGLIAEQLRIQQRTLESILDRLDAIHKVLITPRLTKARELSRDGMENLQKGLLPEALEDLLESAKENRTDFLVQLQVGKLYLYGQNPTDNVINLSNAEKHLRLAARYANSEIQRLPDARKFCGEAFLHAAISCYAQANAGWLAGDVDEAMLFTEEALELSQKATEVYPQLAEAFYHHAKFAALLGDGETAQNSLKTSILADRRYCIKADTDRDFDGVREYVYNLFESLHQQAKLLSLLALASVKKNLDDWNFQCPEAKRAEPEIRKLFQQAESLYGRDTYFDYLDALLLLEKVQPIFDPIPQKENLYQQAREEATEAFETGKKLLEDWVFQDEVKTFESKIRDLLQQAEKLYLKDTYPDYLDALSLLNEAQETFKQTPHFSHSEIATLRGESPLFSPDDRYLAIKSSDTCTIYQTDGFEEITTLSWSSPEFSSDSKYFAIKSGDTYTIYQTDGFEEIATLRGSSPEFSSDSKYFAIKSGDTYTIYQTDGFEEIATLRGIGPKFYPDSRYLVSTNIDDTHTIYQTDGFEEIATLRGRYPKFSPDSRYLISISSGDTYKIYQTNGFEEIVTLSGRDPEFSPDSRYLISISSGKSGKDYKIYQTDGFKEIATLRGSFLKFSPDSKYFAIRSSGDSKIYQTDGFKRITTLSGEYSNFSPDSKYFAISNGDTCKIYQTDAGEFRFKEIATLRGRYPNFSPDSRYFANSDLTTTTVKIYRVKCVIPRKEFEEQKKRQIEIEKEAEQQRKKLEERRKQESERKQKEQELREYRLKNKLCLECGEKLSFWDKLRGAQYCRRHKK